MATTRARTKARGAQTRRSAKRTVRGRRSAVRAAIVAQHEPIELKDNLVEAALASGEHSGVLEDYFGPAQYAELKRLAQTAAARGVRGGDRVLILPGIMGSKLGHDVPGPFDDVIWADPINIALGRLGELVLHGGQPDIKALGVMLFAYLKLKLKLQIAGYSADFFAYDWRLDLIGLGKKLAAQIKAEGRKVHLVAHSMGGLVARASLLEKPKGLGRIVMLGTPNFGSFAPIQAIRGNYSLANKIAFIDLSHSKEDLARLFCSFPGLCEMIPSPDKYPGDFFQLSSWPGKGVRPEKAALASALKVQRQLPTDCPDLFIIAGVDQETVIDATIKDDEFVYTTSFAGDGTVPLQCVLLPSAKQTYYIAESHGSLPNNSNVERAVDAILATGETSILPTSYETRRAAPLRIVSERALDIPPYQGNRGRRLSTAEKRHLLQEVAAPDTAAPAAPLGGFPIAPFATVTSDEVADSIVIGRQRQHRLEITLAFGSITEVEADAYVLGMFQQVPPGGAAQALDDLLGGAIGQMTSRRMFNANVGEISILPTVKHPVRADLIAFAGLGSFDNFNPATLETIAENLVRTFISTRIDEFATVPIGASTIGFTADSLRRLMTGFLKGLQDAGRDHRFRGITICETDRERFAMLQRDFYQLCATKLFDGVEVTLREVELPPPAQVAARRDAAPPVPQSVFLIVRDESKPNSKVIEYGSSVLTVGSKATVYKGRQSITKTKLDQHLGQLASERSLTLTALQKFGTELARLVLPENVSTILKRHLDKPLVVVHDAATSRIPWETLHLADKFPAMEAGLSHRYEAEDLSIAKWLEERQRKPVLEILLVVNPTKDLSGADAEGERIKMILEKLKPAISIRELKGDQARKHEVAQCMASGNFDVIHYAGHAYFDPVDAAKSGILCSGREVLSGADLAAIGSLPSLAFFNACESGRVRRGTQNAKMNPRLSTDHRVQRGASFAEAFLRGGVANYVGTYWPVGDDAALAFAENFYQQLLAGETLGSAIMTGRQILAKMRSADWADYVFYGDPAFVLKKRIEAHP